MKVNKKIAISIALASSFAINTATFAQEGSTTTKAIAKVVSVKEETVIEKVAVSAPRLLRTDNPNIMWDRFLSSHGLNEGWNKLPSGNVYIAKGEATVGKSTRSKHFISSRNIAFEKALVFAQEAMSSELSSTSSLKTMYSIEDMFSELPPALDNARNEISIFDKINKLTNEALDEQIKKYDPSWSSEGKTKSQINAKIVETREQFQKVMADKTSLWLQGSSTIYNTEGPDSEGMYTVVVGLAWSPSYSKVVTNLIDKNQPAPKGKPNKPILDQINAKLVKDSDWLTKQMGLRVMRDENGNRALVGFYNVSKQGAKRVYQKKAKKSANAQMTSFVSSKLAASDLLRQAETQDFNTDGTLTAYNEETYKEKINVVSKEVNFNGRTLIKQWEGRHPTINSQKIFGVVTLWSPATRDQALETIKLIKETRDIQYKNKHGNAAVKGSKTEQNNEPEHVGPQAVTGFGSGAFSIDDF